MRLSGIPAVDIALRELYSFMEGFTLHNIDFHQRRIINAHPSKDDYDYVVRKELIDTVGGLSTKNVSQLSQSVTVSGSENVVFGIGIGTPCAIGVDATPPRPWVNEKRGRPQFTAIVGNQHPTGSDLKIDIKQNGVSVFTSGFAILPAGTPNKQITLVTGAYLPVTFGRYDILTIDILGVGSILAGQDINVFTYCTLI